MYKALFTDLDGTLFDDDKNISPENLRALNKIKSEGKMVAICSGRQIDYVRRINDKIGSNDYVIASNGAVIYDCKNNETLFTSNIPKDRCKYLIEYGLEKGFLIRVDTPYVRYLSDMSKAISTEIELDKDIDRFVRGTDVIQITFCIENKDDLSEITSYVENECYDLSIANKFMSHIGNYKYWAINILNCSASKGNAISGLCKYLKINTDEAVAIGDDLNDVSMMQAVGMGVAMDNAVEEVKKSVDHHIERLIDLESWPEIKSVYHATAKEVEMNEVRNE